MTYHLERRRNIWQGSDRKGRALAYFNLSIGALNLTLAVLNVRRGNWWIIPVNLFAVLIMLWAAYTALRTGCVRECRRWLEAEDRRRMNWRWN